MLQGKESLDKIMKCTGLGKRTYYVIISTIQKGTSLITGSFNINY